MKEITYGSVCSGIEAASVAWEPLGFKPTWFAEIEPFPCAVLADRWPTVTNMGDMTLLADRIRDREIPAPDILVGGTPCQSYSIAGLRAGRKDPRGALTFSYLDLVNAIDDVRRKDIKPPAVAVWENVPGVLSDKDNAFGQFLAGLAGEDAEFEPGPRPDTGKNSRYWRWNKKTSKHVACWPERGCVYGPQRKVAWRVLDAQYYDVAQRRKRVFVVASAGDRFDPSEILFEFEGLRRDIAPSRGTEKAVAAHTARGVGTCGADDNQAQAGHIQPVVGAIAAHSFTGGAGGRPEGAAAGHFIPVSVTGDVCHALKAEDHDGGEGGTGRGTPVIATYGMNEFVEYADDDTASTIEAHDNKDETGLTVVSIHGTQDPDLKVGLAHTLGRNHGQENVCKAFSYKDHGADAAVDMAPTLRAGNSNFSHTNGGQPPAIAYAFKAGQGAKAGGIGFAEEQPPTLTSTASGTNLAPTLIRNTAVRRLTPRECERLQGFPDDHTLIPYGKTIRPEKMDRDYAKYLMRGGNLTFEECCRLAADGPRYKALGNSMAVPVMRWIGKRIKAALSVANTETAIAFPTAAFLPNLERKPKSDEELMRPFLKWPGGKFEVFRTIEQHLPSSGRLIEPFAGAGSTFLNAGYSANVIADLNSDLINTYVALKEHAHALITLTRRFFDDYRTKEGYMAVKEKFNRMHYTRIERAAAFIYLNKHCFHGLVRYNLKGEFNVGWGSPKSAYFPLTEIEHFLSVADRCEFRCSSFEETIALAGAGDVIFCDPPYEPLPGANGFTKYAGETFGFDKQEQLVDSIKSAVSRGARAIITNSGAPKIRELYIDSGFTLHQLNSRRSISCKSKGRERVNDVIAVLKPHNS